VSRTAHVHRPRLRLRDRVALGFGLLALLLSTVIALAVWVMASHYLNRDREISARAETADNAQLIDAEIARGIAASDQLLESLNYPPGTAAVLLDRGHVYRNRDAAALDLPPNLEQDVVNGPTTTERVSLGGMPFLEVAKGLRQPGRAYVEFRPLDELERTLTRTWLLLGGAALLATLLGAAFGLFASRRMLQPLADVTQAASSVAHGDLSARLVPRGDPDLDDLAASFNRTAEELEQRVQADARFASDVSHELRTPLTTMLNSVALLENRRTMLPEDLTEPLDLLSEDLHRFRELVVDLLEISRIDEGRDPILLERVLVGELVRRAADGAAGRPVTMVESSAQDLVVLADKRRLERVLVNLVRNAETHGVACRAVVVRASRDTVTITVDDSGPGVAPERRSRVFERFARGSTAEGGTGLGLAIAQRHVRLHGGALTLGEAPGGGARFVVELPVDPRRERVALTADGSRTGPGIPAPTARATPPSDGSPTRQAQLRLP
jgi:two-component system sensor histidine kinase MtrB